MPSERILQNIQAVEKEVKAYRIAWQKEYKESLYTLCKFGLGYSDTNLYTHGAMIDALESETKRKLIVMPRGTFKSSIGVVGFSIWNLIRNPDARIMIDSESYQNSRNFIREIKGKLELPELSSLFGVFRSKSNWSEGSITINQRSKVLKEPSIVASGVTANKVGQHYDVIIHDDLNTDKNSNTPELCQKVLDHYKMNTSILEPDGVMVVIGTRYSELDVIQFILDNEVNPKKGLL